MSDVPGEPSPQGFAGHTAIEEAQLRSVLGMFATGVVIVAGIGRRGPVGLTCQSFVSLSIDPPLVALAPARTSLSWPVIDKAGAFCVNILAEGQEALARAFAVSGGEKFAGVGWTPAPSGSPRLDGALAWIDCRLVKAHDGGDHYLVVGRIGALGSSTGAPLVYYRAGYGSFGV